MFLLTQLTGMATFSDTYLGFRFVNLPVIHTVPGETPHVLLPTSRWGTLCCGIIVKTESGQDDYKPDRDAFAGPLFCCFKMSNKGLRPLAEAHSIMVLLEQTQLKYF